LHGHDSTLWNIRRSDDYDNKPSVGIGGGGPTVALEMPMAASSAKLGQWQRMRQRILADSKDGELVRPGEGKWWRVTDIVGNKRTHMFAVGFITSDLKGLLYIDDSYAEAEAAGCVEPLNVAQWSHEYQMHYMHFRRQLIDQDNKHSFLDPLFKYTTKHRIHTVVFDWDKVRRVAYLCLDSIS
jgi:hypothetical protein